MNKTIKFILLILIFLLFVPHIASASQNDIAISHLVLLEEVNINDAADGNITIAVGSADIQADVKGSVIVVLGKATINGNVNGDIVSIFGDVEIVNDSHVMGNLVSIGKLIIGDNVEVTGTKFTLNFDVISFFKSNGILINALILGSLIVLVAGLLLITIFSDRYRAMSSAMGTRLSRRMVLGGLVVISSTIVLAFLMFLVVTPILYVLLFMFADIVTSIYVGSLIFNKIYERSTIYLQFFVGHILISIFKIVPVILLPSGSYNALMIYGICFIIVQFVLGVFGVGTIIDTSFGNNKVSKI